MDPYNLNDKKSKQEIFAVGCRSKLQNQRAKIMIRQKKLAHLIALYYFLAIARYLDIYYNSLL